MHSSRFHLSPVLRRATPSACGAIGLCLLAACVAPQDAPPATGSSEQAIVGGTNDFDTEEANVVVRVQKGAGGYCTGTLISPGIVLTAAHCFVSDACVPEATEGKIFLGQRYGALRPERQPPATSFVEPDRAWSRPFHQARLLGHACSGTGHSGFDAALVYLDGLELTPRSRRPSFNARVGTGGVTLSQVSIAGWSPLGVAAAPGFEGVFAAQRQRSLFWEAEMDRSAGNGGFYWEHEYDPFAGQTRLGDSGGPLFYVDTDGSRDVIGVLSGGRDNENPQRTTGSESWTDITRGSNRAWLEANALDSTVNGGHPAHWLAQHGKGSDFWFGEVDYTGPCRKDVDDDCDGWFDRGAVVHDNCPNLPNPEQVDSNGDGVGDACQRCPWDPKGDEDGDGVCGDGPGRPASARVDNCPKVSNADQANCNVDSEVNRAKVTGRAPVLLGDACDPVPCPKVVEHPGEGFATGGSSYDPEWGGTIFGRIRYDKIDPRPIPSHVAHAEKRAIPVDNGNLTTHARFCQNDVGNNWYCMEHPVNFRDSGLFDFPNAASEQNRREFPWHRVSHSPFLMPRGIHFQWPYTKATMDGTAGMATERWDFLSDMAEWGRRNLIPLPEPGTALCNSLHAVGEGTCLDGVMWYHADTTAGRTADQVEGRFIGLHGGDDQVANHYHTWRPDEPFLSALKGHGKYRRLFWWEKLFADSPYDRIKRKTHPRAVGLDDENVVRFMHDNGAGQAIDPGKQSEGVRKRFEHDNTLAPSLESSSAGSSLDGAVLGAFVSNDGHTVLDTLVSSPKGLVLGSESGGALVSGGEAEAPSPRRDFTAFTSPALGAVVVLGGTDAITGEPTPTLHLYRFGLGWVAPRLHGTELGTVVDAAYSPADRMIWVLDSIDAGKIRIVRVDPFTGSVAPAGEYEWNVASHPRIGLGIDAAGGVLLYSSSHGATQLATVSLFRKKAMASTMNVIEGLPTGHPFATPNEVSLLTLDGQDRIAGVARVESLTPVPLQVLTEMFR